ncbi:uncharacterized protein YneF (UPF0154 family) [Bacillus niacini]|jgi:hypothetical protein|uniref:Uncharacterized protein YneF (UPF0154 family) n=1 Tax=Neobacillus niacini TaxID=86668 RepID=A0A852TCL1_9BACI|nr:hypothetical protein [Neobacillus niacini]NYE06522.1 uncharacterized protein YneF (UPF0154 family) [Neobacillus niacini]
MFIQGSIIAGEFDSSLNEFAIQQVKHFETVSILNENQLNQIYHYLKRNQHQEDGQIITLYDQMPIRLSQEEINQFIDDLEKVKLMYQ